ncbi:MAG: AraC family transcriptional regulator [Bacteroidia bacterium]|nr:AraC family transcriptional regulator [Bacteroidia bacterium]MBT8269612.1 AraC family transcriptional regulator [Bacteroidia bacterium]NNF81104.1 helix-turn-helix transcriptional regulator [Flavobacteriaceae bacterium]NNK69151.1 helix-turn-helix transcriptional regulator [Flavobacteriaceae bacterium]NNL80556.1 helix-turn-helix transcriptional regulator [Flavobacteriaceae bacterium]
MEVIKIQEGFKVIKVRNESSGNSITNHHVDRTCIQMHFCLNGIGTLHYGPHYSRGLEEGNSMMLYNPDTELPINLELSVKGRFVIFVFSIQQFHSFFSQVADHIPFLNEENKHKKYYLDKALSPSEVLVLNQIMDEQKNNSMQKLYLKAKAYETLCLYFGETAEDHQSCPFLEDEDNVEKIKQAKRIVIANMAEPPGLQSLADDVGLSVSKLKEGFKHLYGESVFNFLLDYKLEFARKQLLTRRFNVSEISAQVGYSAPSHFISAFRKKYGTTPKQYIMSMSAT